MRVREPVAMPDGTIGRGRFDRLTRLLHWLTVVLVIFQLASGWSFVSTEGTSLFSVVLTLHRSGGSAVWVITAIRLCWRATFAKFPPFPAGLPYAMAWAAKTSEWALYALLLCEPVAGLADTLLRGKPFEFFVWTVPALLPRSLPWFNFFHELHERGAWALAALVGLHALAALFHHLVLKDEVLEAMWPGPR
jgi:cytochrome b561